ncbi:MAG: coniferyl aldehyde dehydrogenase [Hydrogenophaga sp.]|nr:coniferyl aldehyde dehydrogenase [Hydrogenophaga sp.]
MKTPDTSEAMALTLQDVLARQRRAFQRFPNPSAGERRDDLRRLRRQLQRYQDALAHSVAADFGQRAHAETKMLDILPSILEIDHAVSHVGRWMRRSWRRPELLLASNSLQVTYQPKGVVGIIVPWNFPIYLCFGPLAAALAAGNRVMLKLSEVLPHTRAVIGRMLGEIFPLDQVAVFGEELTDPTAFTALPFDHIIFTGSPAVGKAVMAAAAQNLTPVTLELGGKSPAIVCADYPLEAAARSIAFGKGLNCGQICVSPDYALVPRAQEAAFVAAVQRAFGQLYPAGVVNNPDYSAVVNARQLQRLQGLLDDARDKGATVVSVGEAAGRQMPLQIVTGVTRNMRLMQEEIFGPVLPVFVYDTLGDAIAEVQSQPRPLALYCFTHDAAARDEVLQHTHSGGVTINDCAWHIINHDAPFGGIGNSGMGTYHGVEGFRELSHARTVFSRHRFFPIQLFQPPFGNWAQRLVGRFYLGQPDPSVSSAPSASKDHP